MKNSYNILGIESSASEKEIKFVYRKLAKIYHPDTQGTGNKNMFIKINTAYREIEKNNFIFKDEDLLHKSNQGSDFSGRYYENQKNNYDPEDNIFIKILGFLALIISLLGNLLGIIFSFIYRHGGIIGLGLMIMKSLIK